MTECERIIESGFLPESFFQAETRCGYLVDSNQKKLWAILLDLLNKFDKVCKKNNLTYFLAGGTMLGAVRHKGFIPWDEDVDVAMLREDYEKLIHLSDQFEEPYLLQTPYTDEDAVISFIKVRNTNTTFANLKLMENKLNQGCFLDIFPYDYFDVNDSDVLYEEIKIRLKAIGHYLKRDTEEIIKNDEIIKLLKKKTPLQLYEEVQELAKNAGDKNSPNLTSLVSTMDPYRKKAFLKEMYSSVIYVPFENLSLPIPVGYEQYLSTYYGNYMEYPPVEERGLWFDGYYYSADEPYESFRNRFMNK